MNRKPLIAMLLAGVIVAAPAVSHAKRTEDRQAVEAVMRNFIHAFETDDQVLLRSVFRSDGVMVGYSKSERAIKTTIVNEWARNFTGAPAKDEAQRKRTFEILDVTETGAVAKLVLDYPAWQGVDYIALQKIDGTWMIVSKSWSGKAKAPPR
jgi:hypothetical protein